MLIAGNDEEKRNRLWNYAMRGATILILIVAVFFLYKGFFGNPLEGTWNQEDSDMILEIRGKNQANLVWDNLIENQTLTVDMEYSLDKSNKEITFQIHQDALEAAAKKLDGGASAEDIDSAVSSMRTKFHYSVDGRELTLTEWDYGDQIFFTKGE